MHNQTLAVIDLLA